MKRALIFALALLAAGPARADDRHDTDLIPADFEVLSGTYTNVREFKVLTGRTVFVGQGTGLFIYAGTVTIQGVLSADGRGYAGGGNGANSGTGLPGGQGFGPGFGAGGAAQRGGGGGGYGNADGAAPSGGDGDTLALGGGAGGVEYNSTAAISIPLSADDIFMGSGGGGGGGGDINTISGAGGGGGGVVYFEANYVTITGTITANGLDGGAGLDTFNCTTNPGGGGGGAGGGILIKAIKDLSLSNAVLSARGGIGGAAICPGGGGPFFAGGGGAGGRIKLIYNSTTTFTAVIISTGAGKGGEEGIGFGNYAMAGSSGTVSYGILPSSPTGLALTNVFTSSITYSWDAKPAGWGGAVSLLPGPTWYQFRLYDSTSAAPLSDFYTGVVVSSNITTISETGLNPNTTYQRFITAYTDYGDSMPSGTVSTHTFAAAPQAAAGSAFPSAAADSITFAWSSGTAAAGFNPAYTSYELSRSTLGDFSLAVSTMLLTAISSAPAGLSIDTTYYFRVRALGLNAAYTSFTPVLSTATLCVPPGSSAFTAVNLSSFTLAWSSGTAAFGFNPAWSLYEAQISADSFQTSVSTLTTALGTTFTGLDLGTIYSARVRAVNSNGTPTDFTLSVSTKPGNFTDLNAPGRPEPPTPTSKFSYNGSATFTWYPPSGPVELYRYWLEIGTTPGDNDFLSSSSMPATTLSYAVTGLLSDRSYYARVRAESTAHVMSEFSNAGPGVAVWLAETVNPITKPYNWPNPFDPAVAPTNIGFNLVSPAQVTLKIFTLQGALVYETDANEANGGNKIWQWNGKNGRGSMVEPGGYVGLIIKHYAGGTDSQKFKMAVLY